MGTNSRCSHARINPTPTNNTDVYKTIKKIAYIEIRITDFINKEENEISAICLIATVVLRYKPAAFVLKILDSVSSKLLLRRN